MSDLEKLATLIPHWREHNRAHAEEFTTWATRARAAGMPQVAELVERAASTLSGADKDLAAAASQLSAAGVEAYHHHDEHGRHPH
ncbi:MAG: hypothetical protein J7M15_02260 [Anaerolineae bacterium]|nr:hypothetical protein [Anaerolineae bacterium]